MPLGSVAEFVLREVAEVVLHVLGYQTARIVVPVITFGRVRVAHWSRRTKRRNRGAPSVRFQMPGSPPAKRVMDAELATSLGAMFWLAVAIGGGLAWHHLRH